MSKQFVLNVDETNESGRLEVLGEADYFVRFDYSSHFYGKCTLGACLTLENGDLNLRRDTLEFEAHDLKRGSYQGLCQAATRFFTSVIFRNSGELKTALQSPKVEKSENGLRLSIIPSILWSDKK